MRTVIRPHRSESADSQHGGSSRDPLFTSDTVAFKIEEEGRSTKSAELPELVYEEKNQNKALELRAATDLRKLSAEAIPSWARREHNNYAFGSGSQSISSRSNRRIIPIIGSGVLIGIVAAFFLLTPLDSKQKASGEIAAVVLTPRDDASLAQVTPVSGEPLSVEAGERKQNEQPALSAKELITERNIPLQSRSFLHTGVGSIRDGSPILINTQVNRPENSNSVSEGGISLSARQDGTGRYEVSGSEADWQGGWHVNNPEKNIALGKAYKQYLKDSAGLSAFDDLSVIRSGGSSVSSAFGSK